MKRTLFPIALVLAAGSASAQLKNVWDYTTPSNIGHSVQVAVAPDGGVYAMAVDGDVDNIRLTKTDAKGIFKWSKRMKSTQPWNCHVTVDSMGNPYVSISLGGAMTAVSRLNPSSGAGIWTETFEANKGGGLACDPQNNVVYAGKSNLRPYIVKFSPQGQTLFARSVDMAWHGVHSLAIAANGTIFTTTSTGETENGAIILTPNGTVQTTKVWANYVTYQIYNIAYEAVASVDNNGNCYAVESSADRTYVRIRPIETDTTPTPIEIADPDLIRAYQYYAKFDSKNRMVLTYAVGDVYNTKVHTQWLEFEGGMVKSQKKVTITPDPNYRFSSINADVDFYGQAYVAAACQLDGVWTGKSQLFALDADNPNPLWKTDFSPINNMLYAPAVGVGRWGQAAFANHNENRTAEQIRGTYQTGLRNITINGYAHTGGKTITGTLSMYGDFEDARNVTLTSSSNYAKVAPQVTVPTGDIQAQISVELLPTTIRRAVRIDAKMGGITRSAVFYIEPPVVSALAVFPYSIKGGGMVNATARIDGIAPDGGIKVDLTSDSAAAQIPANVTVEKGATTKNFKFSTAPVTQSTMVKLTATTGSITKTTYLTVTP